jgi:polyisoprenoid-binding protein YceI
MKWNVIPPLALSLAFMIGMAARAEVAPFRAQPGSTVTIDGTSTVHDWSVEGAIIGGFIELERSVLADPTLESVPSLTSKEKHPKLEVFIPVRSLRSGTRGMDTVMHNAMKIKEHPRIEYRLLEMALKNGPSTGANSYEFDTKGELKVAGVTRPIEMVVQMERLPEDRLKFTGGTEVKMTDFGIKPPAPTIGLGLIRTGDEVKITFQWITAPPADTARAAN